MSTYGTILVPLDGSGLALRALPFAKDIARSTGARLVLAYALAPWELPIDMPPQVRSAANELLSSGVDVRVHLCPPRVGSAGRSLVEAADEERAGLIIMATHAHGEVGRTLLGSVADYVVRHASVPVLVLTESSELRWSSGRPQRVLVPLDGSARSEVALEEAVHIAEFSGATLLLLRVADFQAVVDGAEPAGVSFQMEQLLIETRHYLDGLMTRLNDGHIEAEMLAAVGSPELAIPEAVRDRRADLVVMSTHGGGTGTMLLGNVAIRTVQRSLAPVLLIHVLPETSDAVHPYPPVEEQHPLFVALTPAEAALVMRALQGMESLAVTTTTERHLIDQLTEHLQALLRE